MSAPATAQPLKLEVGKAYRTRDGRKVTARWRLGGQFAMFEDGMCEGVLCKGNGQPSCDGFGRWTIVSEWADADGRIQRSGDECPVPPEAVVDWLIRSGLTGYAHLGAYARDLRWGHTESSDDITAYRIAKPAPATPKQERPVDEKMTIECLFECFANWSDDRQAGDQEGMKKAAAEAQRFFDSVNGDDLAQPLALALRSLLDDIAVSGWLGKVATLREATEAMERAKAAGLV